MALYLMREEWKSVLILSWVQSMMTGGDLDLTMLKLCVGSLATVQMVGNTPIQKKSLLSGARSFLGPHFGRGSGPSVLDDVYCGSDDEMLLDCSHRDLFRHNYGHNDDIGIRRQVTFRLKNISATITNNGMSITRMVLPVLATWELQNKTLHEPYLFKMECFSERHKLALSVSNKTFSVQLYGLLSSVATSYTCCMLALYRGGRGAHLDLAVGGKSGGGGCGVKPEVDMDYVIPYNS